MATPAYVLNSLKFWYTTGVKSADDIKALVTDSKISQSDADEILNAT